MSTRRGITVAIVGATGYAGSEAARLLATHPCAKLVHVTSERRAGETFRSESPWLDADLVLQPFDPARIDADFVFLCQEAGFAMRYAEALMKRSRVIDFSADFRLASPADYEQWYKQPHTAPTLIEQAFYCIPELEINENARLVANPGCYPTAALLALAPLRNKIDGIPIIDAKSGVSGAGRSRSETEYIFSELEGGFKPYAVTDHRHIPEIEQRLGGQKVRFTPHLLPIARGICCTIHVAPNGNVTKADILETWQRKYEGRPFITIQSEGMPSTKQVRGSNRCILAAEVDERTGYAILVSVIDNLVKGAAGQAIQTMNILAGLPEQTGLPLNGLWP